MSCMQVFEWYEHLKHSREDLSDNERQGQPKSANGDELVQKLHEFIAFNLKVTLHMLAEEFCICKDVIWEVFTKTWSNQRYTQKQTCCKLKKSRTSLKT